MKSWTTGRQLCWIFNFNFCIRLQVHDGKGGTDNPTQKTPPIEEAIAPKRSGCCEELEREMKSKDNLREVGEEDIFWRLKE
jgi:hypothetical protein